MASPFAVFRRNQRILIAVSGIMAMIAFVFLDPVMRMLGGGNRALENPVMVKTNYGNFKRSELSAIEDQRRWLGFFLQRIVEARVAKELEGKQIPPNSPYVRQYEMGLYQSIQQQLMARMMPAGDQAALETILLSKRAEEMGMVASDQAVTDYLRSISGDAFGQLRDIIAKLKPDGKIPISQGFLYDALRRELLASKYTQMFQLGMAGMPPAERWEYYEQLHLEANAQVLPVKAEQFLKDVESPGDEKLRAFFELYQNNFPEPNSPDPGFKEPTKVAFQYFRANVDKLAERISDDVTDEEMHEFYEKNKDIQFRQLSLPAAKDKDSKGEDGKMEDPLGSDEPQPDGAQPDKPAPESGGDTPEKKADTPDSNNTDAGATDKGDTDKSNADKSGIDKNPAPKNGKPAGPKSSRINLPRRANPFRLTADEKKPPAEAGGKQADTDAAEDKPAADAPADEAKPDETKSGEQPATDEPTGDKKSEPRYEPFEKVTGTIRTQIAREKAQTTIKTAFDKLYAQMKRYSNARRDYLRDKESDPDAKAPDELDFAALAGEYGVEALATQLISAYEAQTETDIGKSSGSQAGFLELAYAEPKTYQPQITGDGENNTFLWWETKATPEAIPAFDDVRGKVLHAYKLREARKLTLAQAEKYAKEAEAAKKPLSDVFKDREGLEVTDTGPFTRMTTGNTPYDPESSTPRLSNVHGVDAAGEEFMKAVFGLSPGEVQVAWNQPQDVAYVIQLEKFGPSRQSLERDFMVEPFRKYVQVAAGDQRKMYYTWIESIKQDAGVDWVEQPRTNTRVEEE